jgi:hypothetical protein
MNSLAKGVSADAALRLKSTAGCASTPPNVPQIKNGVQRRWRPVPSADDGQTGSPNVYPHLRSAKYKALNFQD